MSATSLFQSPNTVDSPESDKLELVSSIKRQELNVEKSSEIEKLQKIISNLDDQLKDERKAVKSLILALQQRESSLSWRFSQYYGKYFKMSSRLSILISIVLNRILDHQPSGPSYDLTVIYSLKDFLSNNYVDGSILIFSCNKYTENEEQRSARIAQAFSKRGWAVVYVILTSNEQEYYEFGEIYPNIFQVPIDLLIDHRDMFFSCTFRNPKIFIINYPHLALFKILSYANSSNWVTIYDIENDWETFYKAGQAGWYDKDMEGYIILNCDLITTACFSLSEKVEKDFGVKPHRIIPNSISPQIISFRDQCTDFDENNTWDKKAFCFIEEVSRLDQDQSIKRR
jgi:hypothetical protein